MDFAGKNCRENTIKIHPEILKKKKNNNSIVFYEAKMPATLINKSIIRSKEVSEGIWTWGFKF